MKLRDEKTLKAAPEAIRAALAGRLVATKMPVPLCVGMAAAADTITDSAQERRRVAQQRDAFIERLQEGHFPLAVNGPLGDRRHPGNANVRFAGFPAQDTLGAVQPRVAASTGAACASGIPEPSHVLRALGLSAAQAECSIRFSFGRFTTDGEIDEAAGVVGGALQAITAERDHS